MNNPYSVRYLRNSFLDHHVEQYSVRDVDAILQSISLKVSNFEFDFIKFISITTSNGKSIHLADNFETVVLVNAVNLQLQKSFHTKQPDRHQIIQQLINLIKNDHNPMSINKIDVSGFYENIDKTLLQEKINQSSCDIYTKSILNRILNKNFLAQNGLPRGLSISSTLSEVYMSGFDNDIICGLDTYYYARFVDDIVLITYKNSLKVEKLVIDSLKKINLTINAKKTTFNQPLNCSFYEQNNNCSGRFPKAPCSKIECKSDKIFEFLGYQFKVTLDKIDFKENGKVKSKYEKKLSVSIAIKKINKLKTRINLSFILYRKDNNFDLLVKRIKYLSSNCEIIALKSKIKIGLYYNYKHVNNINQIRELDFWFKKFLFSKHSYASNLTYAQKQILSRVSFFNGFSFRLMNVFNRQILSEIVKGWKNV